jgi:diguanylate cyclase
MNASVYILIWMVPSILVSILIGAYIGYGFALRRHGDQIRDERRKTLEALHEVVQSAQALETEVDTHNTELASVERTVGDIATSGDYEHVKDTLLQQISHAIESNRRLNQDLVCTRYRLEEQAQELDRTRVEARVDSLSGVGNRKAFDETLEYMCAKFKRHGQSFALLLIDVDHFKWINDTHGHQSGDVVVSRLGDAFKSAIRPGDHIARYGGDEFAVLLEGVNLETGAIVAQRIRDKVERCNFGTGADDARIAVTLSMGLAIVEGGDSAESLLSKADQALYRSKESGRNRLSLFEADSYQYTPLPVEV